MGVSGSSVCESSPLLGTTTTTNNYNSNSKGSDNSDSSSTSANGVNKYSPINKRSSYSNLRHAPYSSSSLSSSLPFQQHSPQPQPPPLPQSGSGSPDLHRPHSGTGLSNLAPSYDHDDDYDDDQMARSNSKRRYSFSANEYVRLFPDRPLYQRLLSSHHSVTNPNSPFDTYVANNRSTPQLGGHVNGSSVSFATDEPRRLSIIDIVNNLRPSRLIGNVKPLCNWYACYKDDPEDIKNKGLRKFYTEQNYLITKFQEIDNFLDAGKIHYNMLSNYSNDATRVALDNIEEIDESVKSNSNSGHNSPSRYTKNGSTLEDSPNGKSPFIASQDLERVGELTAAAKYTRFYDVPGNVDLDGGKFLGFNQEEDSQAVLQAILVNFLINIILLIGKIIVTLLSNSLSIAASLVDSILDFMSTFIIYIVNRLAAQNNHEVEHAYPVGRSRLEPLGVLIFSIIIIISFFQVGQESFKRLFFSTPEQRVPATVGLDAVAIMLITIVAKLGCWIWCSKSAASSVQALAQDAMTDIVFNTVSLLMPWLGHILNIWWFDPLGALFLSVYIIFSWGKTAFEHINNLTGAVADPLEYKVILYMALRFAEPIKFVTALKVYHVGDNLNVEIDVVFANDKFNLSFKDCHDIAEALQYSIESLPMVERAFVHIDYMEGNYKGHLK
ncbi:uncharacterized protein LODBEIA_P17590 [Lodderomyces beijingensis]|uniref:Cation efflux protein transmembrane domain-containing protein n=1 Tax=Lodderomyces beijingensis TaxID=1775926 RepID=A0ABP0ZK06_9ASCO